MNREVHVRICESVGGKFPCATRLVSQATPLRKGFDNVYKHANYMSMPGHNIHCCLL